MSNPIPTKMKAAVLFGPNDLRVVEKDVPTPVAYEVLIKVMSCAICGSDPTVIKGNWPSMPPYGTFTPGHEFSGEIVAVGPYVEDYKIGDRIAIETHKGCGFCRNCKEGHYTICLNYGKNESGHRHYGFTTNGGYAQFAVVHVSNLYRIADNVSYDEAALVTTASCVHYAIDLAGGFLGGEVVAVFGPGPIGLMAVELSKALGAVKVFLTGTREDRLDVGLKVGADRVIDINEEDVVKTVLAETGGLGVDIAFECTGRKTAIEQAFRVIRKGGRISLIGDPHEEVSLNLRDFVLYEMKTTGVRGEGNGDTRRSLAMLSSGKLNVKPLITHHFALENIDDAFDTYLQRKGGAIKVIVNPN